MKKIIVISMALCFLIACGCEVTINQLENGTFCTNCHYSYCGSDAIASNYRFTRECIKCHVLDICEKGNDWKKRELNKPKKKSKSSKKKRKRR
jgi:hypothetical protein